MHDVHKHNTQIPVVQINVEQEIAEQINCTISDRHTQQDNSVKKRHKKPA